MVRRGETSWLGRVLMQLPYVDVGVLWPRFFFLSKCVGMRAMPVDVSVVRVRVCVWWCVGLCCGWDAAEGKSRLSLSDVDRERQSR